MPCGLAACNRRRIKSGEDFESRDGGVFLNESGRQKLFEAFAKRMRDSVQVPAAGGRLTYERLCVHQARLLAECIRESRCDYKPFVVK